MTKEVKVGIIGIVVFFTTLIVINYAKQQNLFSTNMIITARFDAIDYVKVGQPVYTNGRVMGQVVAVSKEGDNLYLSLDLEPIDVLPKDTRASIYSESILGGTAIALLYDNPCSTGCLETGDIIEGTLDGLQQTVERTAKPILEKIGTVADKINNDSTGLDQSLAAAYASINALRKKTEGWKGSAYKASKTLPATIRNVREMTSGFSSSDIGADASQQAAIDSLLKTMSSLTQEDIDAMTKILYTAAEELPKVEPMVAKATAFLPTVNNKIDTVNQNLQNYFPGNDNMIAKLLHDEALKDTTQIKIQGISTTVGAIRKNPEKYISLKK
jgi:ABC-type transporter Mla subunit MlaD